MKALRRLSATLFLLCLAEMAMAQDVIVMKDQSTVMSKVLEITSTEIKYKKWNNQNGPTYSISRSEVLSINYENGEVESFSETTNNRQNIISQQFQDCSSGYMEEHASFPAAMRLNGRRLSNEELQSLVDEQSYQLFLKGKRQYDIGEIVGITAIAAGVIADVLLKGALRDHEEGYLVPGVVLGSVSLGGITGGLILCFNGWSKMSQVAESYNKGQTGNVSLNISPSMMRCEMPQSQGNYGLGLTFSMNF